MYEGVCVRSKSILGSIVFVPVLILDYESIDCLELFEVGRFFVLFCFVFLYI